MADEETLMSRNEVIGFFHRMSTTDVSGSTPFNVMADIDIKSIIKEEMKQGNRTERYASDPVAPSLTPKLRLGFRLAKGMSGGRSDGSGIRG